MRRSLLIAALLITLSGCGKEKPPVVEEDGGGPQIATSIDDVALPVDRSDQITAIDATTGDAAGMPKDGGAVVHAPKPEARPAVEPGKEAAAVPVAAPTVAVPPPVVTLPTAGPAPGRTIG
ncbi:hypothetical protein ACFSTI_22125 [Rhizorhabdus histidinilytica]